MNLLIFMSKKVAPFSSQTTIQVHTARNHLRGLAKTNDAKRRITKIYCGPMCQYANVVTPLEVRGSTPTLAVLHDPSRMQNGD